MIERFNRESIYREVPIWMQHGLASLEGLRLKRLRYGPGYVEMERAVEERWNLDRKALQELQGRRLRQHLIVANDSEFWRARFNLHNVRPQGSDPFAELSKLPVLSKLEARENAHRIEIPSSGSPLRAVHTSGTTGSGLLFHETPQAERERWAIWWRYRKQFGLHRKVRCGYFGGRSIVPLAQKKPPFWRHNWPGRQLIMSAYHLSPSTVGDYWRALNDWRVEWIHGYPSFISLLSELASDCGLPRIGSLRWITTGAENLLSSQRRRIEQTFGINVYQHYGMAESVANISERLDGTLRVDEDFALVEFVQLAHAENNSHRIVGTNWSNPAFPLFRYDTGDVATLPQSSSQEVWRPINAIDGRFEDFVLLPSGVKIGRLDHIFKDLIHIREAQIYQPKLSEVIFRVVKGAGYDEAQTERRLVSEARIRLGSEIQVKIHYVDEVEKTRSGKLRFVVSDLRAGRLEPSIRGDSV